MSGLMKLSVGMSLNIDHSAISNMTLNPTGMVSSYTRSVAKSIRKTARIITIRKTGKADARAGGRISTKKPMWQQYHVRLNRSSPTDVVWHVSNGSPHAVFVFLGTVGPIKSSTGKVMPVGKSQLGLSGAARIPAGQSKTYGVVYKDSVSGQKARNFLMEATRKVYVARGL